MPVEPCRPVRRRAKRRSAGNEHAVFVVALADQRFAGGIEWCASLAGLAALRLVDAWALAETRIPSHTVDVVNRTLDLVARGAPERPILRELAAAVHRERDRSTSRVLPRVVTYASVLASRGAWAFAADAYNTVLRHASAVHERALVPDVYACLSLCFHWQDQIDAAHAAGVSGRAAARELGDRGAMRRLRCLEHCVAGRTALAQA
jgi:hypothetical protein